MGFFSDIVGTVSRPVENISSGVGSVFSGNVGSGLKQIGQGGIDALTYAPKLAAQTIPQVTGSLGAIASSPAVEGAVTTFGSTALGLPPGTLGAFLGQGQSPDKISGESSKAIPQASYTPQAVPLVSQGSNMSIILVAALAVGAALLIRKK